MLLFADGDGFWTMKTVIDLIAVVGLVLTLFSIWFTWWLSKRDLSNRIAAAQDETLLRIRLVIVRTDLGRI